MFKRVAAVITTGLLAVALTAVAGASQSATTTYEVTLVNLTDGQPFSPPVAATHNPAAIRMFRVGQKASVELEAIAEDGNEVPMFELFEASQRVTQAVDVARPLTRLGTVVGEFNDSVRFEITARPGDKLSLATMLICTNDGFLGLDSVNLPRSGQVRTFLLAGYDAGTEDNTEVSADLVDPCTDLGPVALPGDPDGNEDLAVDTDPQVRIRHHPGIAGVGDLTADLHGWTDPVGLVIVESLD